MFGRIRPSPASMETLEGSPSKILKDDSFSIYEATLMKLKLGAQRDTSAFCKEADEIMIDDSAISSSEGTNVMSNCLSASGSSSQRTPNLAGDGSMMIDSDCSSISASPSRNQLPTVTLEQPRQSNISIIHFFPKLKDSRRTGGIDSPCGESVSTENDRPPSVTSSCSERNYRTERESIQSSPVSELME